MQNPYEFDCEFINEFSINYNNISREKIKRKGELLNNNISKTRKINRSSYNEDSYNQDSYNEIKVLYKKLKIS